MGANNMVVIAARNSGTADKPNYVYTAKVVQSPEDFLHPADGIAKAKQEFYENSAGRTWFTSLGRAKSFAALLRAELLILDYPALLVIEIGTNRIRFLSQHGRPLPTLPRIAKYATTL